ncbi:hypothetical protein [Haloquadratum walsbyi]|jgi:chromosome partitioning protein|uniref:Uncharacterized protein n=1 Tax=Haloquadratum walsbyi J07HQW2 TaxID=1238425 RepID=U1NJC5_9EURY|nr:hypothetical protein [Haloquadratum walsbyi]ERG97335.1 MAG: hypothetical protein J07HQW2_03821 [Haloquadratum walsbyi J07HQW2]
MNISSIGAILNEVPTNESASRSVQTWFNDTFGSENVFELDDRAVVEHAIKHRTSLFEYDPDDAGYPWRGMRVLWVTCVTRTIRLLNMWRLHYE